MTKAQRKQKARTAAKKRGIAKAVKGLLSKVNPGKKVHAVKVRRLKGGGVSIHPVKVAKA